MSQELFFSKEIVVKKIQELVGYRCPSARLRLSYLEALQRQFQNFSQWPKYGLQIVHHL